jgi:E3 ubiquitin-protein ligase HECTD2
MMPSNHMRNKEHINNFFFHNIVQPVSVIRAMMTSIDKLLRRPGVPLKRISDVRFLLIMLEVSVRSRMIPSCLHIFNQILKNPLLAQHNFAEETRYHHNILKRILGMLSGLSNECHQAIANWFAK